MGSRILLIVAGLALCHAQQYEHKQPLPAILSHKQGQTQDGAFQYSFSADNGLQQGESISPDGSRKGAYSYIDPNGKTITVSYTADKNGFQVHGDHLPKPVQPVAPAPAAPQQQYYQPQPQQQQYQAAPAPQQYYQPQQSYNNGPALFSPSAAPRPSYQAAPRPSYQAAPSHTQANFVPQHQQQQEEYQEPEHDPTKPHNFGSGYSFQFAG